MKFENIRVYNFEHALRGMRNPKNSWHLSDSLFGIGTEEEMNEQCVYVTELWAAGLPRDEEDRINGETYQTLAAAVRTNGVIAANDKYCEWAFIGPKDMNLAQVLIRGGSEHRKFLRQIMVTVDITAPLYWWKEFDTYKVGTTANSTSTMHKLTSKPITADCFEMDDYVEIEMDNCNPNMIIEYCEALRQKYLSFQEAAKNAADADRAAELTAEAKIVWKELVRWLPESWLQTRTVTLNYENLLSICHQRKAHKLNEWCGRYAATPSFLGFAHALPYAEDLLFLQDHSNEEATSN